MSNTEAAITFLKKWNPEGLWLLTAIHVDQKSPLSTRTFKASEEDKLRKWLNEYNGVRNIYFSVNEVNKELSSKAHKEDIKSARWLHVDIDPEEGQDLLQERDRILSILTDKIPKGIPKPTVIVFSGGGYQAFWRLKEKVIVDGEIQKCEDFERYNKRLEQIFGGDHCHNIDRIMRLPGTVNIPNIKKQKAGRKEELALLIEFNSVSYDLSEFKQSTDIQMGSAHQGGQYGYEVEVPGNVERIIDLSELDKWSVKQRVKVIIAQGFHPEEKKEKDNSRSAWLFDCVCSLVRSGVPDGVIFSIITDKDWGISESVLQAKPNAEKYAIRQIKNAKEYNEDPNLLMMNQRHAIIGNIGGKCRVIEEIEDDILGRSRLTVSSFEDIRNRYSNIKIKVGEDKDGKDITKTLGKYWLDHPMRRQFDYIRFLPNGDKPGNYNLWRGFAVQAVPGDCSLYLDHLKINICSNNEEYYQYLIKWMARAVQTPGSPGEVAIVIRGGKGVGKGLFAREFGKLFGRHNLQIANPSHLVGNFNAHLRDVIILFADEAFYANDKKHESVLKMLVTEDTIPIEVKGVDVEPYPNYVHLIMAANDPHVIRASGDERRFFVLTVNEENKQNTKYFGDMIKQMDNGGREALLYHLQSIDLTNFQVRDVVKTDALQEQKLLSMSIEEEWWFVKLQRGLISDTDTKWENIVLCDAIFNDFIEYAEKWRVLRRGNETSLGKTLQRLIPKLKKIQKIVMIDEYDGSGNHSSRKKRAYHYTIDSLSNCRKHWESLFGKCEWPNDGEFNFEKQEVPF